MPRLWGTPCKEVAHVHGCLLQDLIFRNAMRFRGKPREGQEKVRPQRAADTGVGRDTEQQSPDRQLVVMGWTGIAGSLRPLADVTVTLRSHPFPFHLGKGGQMAFLGS